MSDDTFEPRYRWAIYREMKRLRERHAAATDENFELLYEQIRDVVLGNIALDNLDPSQRLQHVVLASRRAVTVMAEMLDSGGTNADGEADQEADAPQARHRSREAEGRG